MGQLVCAVVAESEVQAKQAAKRVKIVYQDLQPVILTIQVMTHMIMPIQEPQEERSVNMLTQVSKLIQSGFQVAGPLLELVVSICPLPLLSALQAVCPVVIDDSHLASLWSLGKRKSVSPAFQPQVRCSLIRPLRSHVHL